METIIKPKYYDEMCKYFPQDIEGRIGEIETEMADLRAIKGRNRVTAEDIENVSDNYQYNLEWNYALSELSDELLCLQYHQQINVKTNN